MSPFKSQQIKKMNLGQVFLQAREAAGFSLDSLAAQLKIKKEFLIKIEANELHELPGEFYIKTFVKKYAQALNIRWSKIEAAVESELKLYQKWQTKTLPDQLVNKSNLLVVPHILRRFLILFIIGCLLIYLVFQIINITQPPTLKIFNPAQKAINASGNKFIVNGQTDANAKVEINSFAVIPDDTGFFSLQLDLSPGSNIIRIEAKNSYSRTAVEQREIIVN